MELGMGTGPPPDRDVAISRRTPVCTSAAAGRLDYAAVVENDGGLEAPEPAGAPGQAELRRTLSLPLMALYGLGTILGAGIYVLTGAVAERAGMAAPLSFLLAAAVAAITGLSFAELCTRFPKSAGEALYVARGLSSERLGTIVGLLVLTTGIVSAATMAVGFQGYLSVFVDLPRWVAIVALLAALTAVSLWGIAESVLAAGIVTIIEVGGLVAIVVVAGDALGTLPERAAEMWPSDLQQWLGTGAGAFLAFYAFIGFEDMVNVAEEVRGPERTMPRAIVFAVATSTVLYVLVALVAVLALPVQELAGSHTPIADIFVAATGRSPHLISLVSIFAIVNGALIQVVMGARIVYGLARLGWIPPALGEVSKRTRTPLTATLLVAAIITVLAILVPLTALAEITSFIILCVFTLVHASLWRLHRRAPDAPFRVPRALPIIGTIACALMVLGRTLMMLGAWRP